jgi:hypothetical protein
VISILEDMIGFPIDTIHIGSCDLLSTLGMDSAGKISEGSSLSQEYHILIRRKTVDELILESRTCERMDIDESSGIFQLRIDVMCRDTILCDIMHLACAYLELDGE